MEKILKIDNFTHNLQNLTYVAIFWKIWTKHQNIAFSKVNIVMIKGRKSMSSEILNHLCLLSFERDLTLHLEANLKLVRLEFYKLNKASQSSE